MVALEPTGTVVGEAFAARRIVRGTTRRLSLGLAADE